MKQVEKIRKKTRAFRLVSTVVSSSLAKSWTYWFIEVNRCSFSADTLKWKKKVWKPVQQFNNERTCLII